MRKALLFLPLLVLGFAATATGDDGERFLVIVVDGLRPDYITPNVMPNVSRIAETGVFFENHHSIYPTVTRVNASSLSTGSHPARHGLLGNTVYFPEVDAEKGLTTSDYANLQRIAEAEEGALLTASTLGEVLEANGHSILAVSSGSSGSALLLNPTLAGQGVMNVNAILPESNREAVESVIGPAPEDSIPAKARNAWVVDAYIAFALERSHPLVTQMWLTDPDHTAHPEGMGAPKTVEALRAVDGEIGRILGAHADRDLLGTVNILLTSDHGFSTQRGGFNPLGLLLKHGLRGSVVLAGTAMYVDDRDPGRIEQIVRLLQAEDWAGAIFTQAAAAGDYRGWVDGTLSFHAAQWRHPRSADILVSPNWDDGINEYGYAGRTTFPGVAGHGSSSPYDIRGTLIAHGPAFKKGARSSVPTSNADIAPTILHVLGLAPPPTMTGRPTREALANGPKPEDVEVETTIHAVKTDGYRLELSESVVDGRRYFNSTRVSR